MPSPLSSLHCIYAITDDVLRYTTIIPYGCFLRAYGALISDIWREGEEVIDEKGSSKGGRRRWNGIGEIKQRWLRRCDEGSDRT